MRDEELVHIAEKQFSQELNKLLEKGQKIEQEGEYDVIKIPKPTIENFGKKELKHRPFGELEMGYHPHSMIEPKRKRNNNIRKKKVSLEKITEELPQQPEGQQHHLTKVNSEAYDYSNSDHQT